ncbi:MAG: 30S ribosomal protein S15 [Candidatus Marinimicrobia bacterium]|jgi:small subunit ribosomal protein S15|nr:30S ribosomal protein S15 [Candidatus Neomarinimicrobiota bacterium]MDP6593744.1 30S ribosomal protein S15 [Candidatus Neomarinimicrobiota bacterium]MDP6837067.1 30S ribosomal protein S15 [Candidatus Neomarinimicrobiota bacterium]MDP6966691.1 30S ribosomal protein S15 [Candidatus Neomarinimicrobiota bacterium]|tara:strand:- start:3885 stop:4154 length:270 start_codon:yes stop_codon:yes gene_type:complete
MPLVKEKKQEIVTTFGKDEKDVGSTEVQIASLTERIRDLNTHFKTHKRDHHSRRGLTMMVSRRRRLLKYLKRVDYENYIKITSDLNIRR